MMGSITTTQPNEQGGKTNQGQQQDKKFLSKKERIQKKEEERRARQNQEKDSQQMGSVLYQEAHDFNYKLVLGKRRKSTEIKLIELDEIEDRQKKKKGITNSPSMSKLIMSGSLAHKFVEVLQKPDALVSDLLRLSTKQNSARAALGQKK